LRRRLLLHRRCLHPPLATLFAADESQRAWIDISRAIHADMAIWPGDPLTEIRVTPPSATNPYQTSTLRMSLHAGTHVDGPRHLDPNSPGVDAFPLDLALGEALVLDVGNDQGRIADPEALENALSGTKVDRLLLRTHPSDGDENLPPGNAYVALGLEGARRLLHDGCQLVGTNAPSIGAPDDEGEAVHRLLLRGGVWILEGLDLSAAPTGLVELLCLPLRITDGDGAPVRALVRRVEGQR
jgi:arylformamidase